MPDLYGLLSRFLLRACHRYMRFTGFCHSSRQVYGSYIVWVIDGADEDARIPCRSLAISKQNDGVAGGLAEQTVGGIGRAGASRVVFGSGNDQFRVFDPYLLECCGYRIWMQRTVDVDLVGWQWQTLAVLVFRHRCDYTMDFGDQFINRIRFLVVCPLRN
ncbi:MAG: hypothetical protein WBE01_15390 [Methyloceanibacter sp.]